MFGLFKPNVKKMEKNKDIDSLLWALRNENSNVRREAAEALGRIGDVKAVEPLIKAFVDMNEQVRHSAAEAVGRIGEPAIEPLSQALRDSEEIVQMQAVRALGKMGSARAIELLIGAFMTDDWGFQILVSDVLAQTGERAVEPLIQALQHEFGSIRKGAAMGLGKIRSAKAVEPLVQALKDYDLGVKQEALSALVEIGEPAVELLIQAAGDSETHSSAVMALANIADPRAFEVLTQALNHEDTIIRARVAKGLEKIKAKKSQ